MILYMIPFSYSQPVTFIDLTVWCFTRIRYLMCLDHMDDEVHRRLHTSSSSSLTSSSHTCEKCMYLCDHTWPELGSHILWKYCNGGRMMILSEIAHKHLELNRWHAPFRVRYSQSFSDYPELWKDSFHLIIPHTEQYIHQLHFSYLHIYNLSFALAFNNHLIKHLLFEPCLHF